MEVLVRSSPNHGPRRENARPDLVVIHYTGMWTAEAALERLCDPAAEVSAHYLIAEDGRVWALVPESERAWHAGAGAWGAVTDVNSRSIGIELANPGPLDDHPPFPEPQMAALEGLLAAIRARWAIAPARIIGHSDMAPGRKSDPGPKFDWARLARSGHAIRPQLEPGTGSGSFAEATRRIGYRAPEGNPDALLEAFRLRFRPMGRGPIGDADLALARAVAAQFPCVDGPAQSA